MGITLISNLVVDVRLPLPLARLLDIGGSDIRYERAAGGFQMFAMAENTGPGCAIQVGGVTDQECGAAESHTGLVVDLTASTKFSGFSIPCP
jgi:hypothetical protein